jgi:heme/copper-type cytochrome/quinol oxidase subunit 3
MTDPRRDLDVSRLPTYGFGNRMTMAWGTSGFIALEGTGFALAIGAYLYLAVINPEWPIGVTPPSLLWSTLVTISLLISVWPNHIAKRNARRENLLLVRRDLVIMSFAGVIPLIFRIFEFRALNISWDQNAYGSILWIVLGLHTTHLLTDVIDTLVLTALMFTRHGKGRRFCDVEDNAVYWDFVVLSWLLVYVVLYWFPRWWPT